MSLKRNSSGALIRNAATGALCSTCCQAEGNLFFEYYMIWDSKVVPLSSDLAFYGYRWSVSLWNNSGNTYELAISRLNGSQVFDFYKITTAQTTLSGLPLGTANPNPDVTDHTLLGGQAIELKQGYILVDLENGTAVEA